MTSAADTPAALAFFSSLAFFFSSFFAASSISFAARLTSSSYDAPQPTKHATIEEAHSTRATGIKQCIQGPHLQLLPLLGEVVLPPVQLLVVHVPAETHRDSR